MNLGEVINVEDPVRGDSCGYEDPSLGRRAGPGVRNEGVPQKFVLTPVDSSVRAGLAAGRHCCFLNGCPLNVFRDLTQTTTATATRKSPNNRTEEQYNDCQYLGMGKKR